ncbi:non-ribosomal peptide synthetase [Actinophytocola oryzae]|uniref:Amino acid adenylation domain-containing protein n=1 Tax=Actinophytocola oryzae TaxID=502181 RepID=A0A4R7VH76_9PSEU|nr:non-ribosomal peptide synthetase [Actinophytocola oryzae]TDV48686.1 amino acid adenylation domain-containing protein [Actinophytocola oryzae]
MNTGDESLLHRLVERAARRWPDARAVVTTSRTLTYAELDRLANATAARLHHLGVERDELVGVAMRKGWEQVVAVLAVLKAGAAYLPIDPDLPPARFRGLAARGECRCVLTQDWLTVPDLDGVHVLAVTDEQVVAAPAGTSTQADLAYVLFTSGSTGEPKGVMLEHAGVVNTVLDLDERFDVGPGDAVLGLSALSFDMSVYDIFGMLAAGAAVVLPDPEGALDPGHWVELMHANGVTVWNTVPALLAMLVSWLEETAGAAPSPVRLAFLGGDWIPLDLPDRARVYFPDLTMVNIGGATEASICSVFHVVDHVDPEWTSIPYGRPLTGQGCLVLDDGLRPATEGELFITGRGVARGYWRAPELTAASFVTHPVSGERMYRTGDRGRLMADGAIEFLGRADHQVKVRGFRVELGEVEAVLRSCTAVGDAVVVATGPAQSLTGLTAFLTPRPGARPVAEVVLAEARELLPRYMVPDAVRLLDAFPLTGNGKVDRAALAAQAGAGHADGEPPRPGLERRVAEVLCDLLAGPIPSRTASFFELGGNSLVAAQFVARLRRLCHTDIPMTLPFTHPTVAAMAAFLSTQDKPAQAAIRHDPARATPAPVSFGQEQVWFLDRLADGNRAYHFQCDVRFHGGLRPELLRAALTEVVARHEILRTTFEEIDGSVVQIVHDPVAVPLPVEDLRRAPARLTDRIAAELGRSFDLRRGPLVRWRLYRVADEEWVLLHTEHHLVHDGWSLAVLWREIEEHYVAAAGGTEASLPRPLIQFGDFAVWQRDRYAAGRREEVLSYWRRRLAGVRPFDLLVAGPRPPRQTFDGSALRVSLSTDLYARLREFSAAEGTSLFATMFAAFTVLMHRYSGADDLCVGSWMANREREETEGLIGMLVNMVALRTTVTDDLSFRELLGAVRGTVVEALEHQDAPFNDVVRELAPDRDPSRNPLVQTCFSFHDSPMPALRWPGVHGVLTERNNGSAKFDLNVVVIPRAEQRRAGELSDGDHLTLMWEYNTDLLTEGTATVMADHFQQLLAAAVATPDEPVGELSMLTETDRHALTALTAPAPPHGEDVPRLFARQVATRPDAVAVESDDATLTFAELDAAARALACRLVEAGVGVGDRVGVCVRRTHRLPVALLGVLLSGAAYVPLDHRHPAARHELMLADADVRLVVTEPELAGAFAPRPVVPVEGAAPRTALPESPELAYVLYTSGTTGTPKGVRVPHTALANLLLAMRDLTGTTSADTLLAVTTTAFDIAALEIFLPLVTGARLVVAPEETVADGVRLAAMLTERAATVMQATPTTWRMVVESGWRADGRFVALCGGEAMPPDLAGALADRASDCWNLYGPTETTIWSTAYRVRGHEAVVPIGRPLRGTVLRVLDAAGRPVAVGLPGELHVGGVGLALGYTSESSTRERFVASPDGRYYRTGDLVRLRPDGELEFLRRGDRQLKLRGYRIEPGEIEHVLRGCAGVRDCAVELRGDPARLVGYVVGDGFSADAARAHLATRLPGYMVPPVFVPLAALPLSANGKLDRAALPDPAPSGPRDAGNRDENALESRLAAVWAQVLRCDEVGLDDDFFSLGGHSLLALRLISLIHRELNVPADLDLVFEHPTVREQAAALGARP